MRSLQVGQLEVEQLAGSKCWPPGGFVFPCDSPLSENNSHYWGDKVIIGE